jgi:hypothetical protein
MRWSARHRTGAEPGAEGAFTVDALQVLGVPVPVGDLAAAQEAINAALAPTGFRVELPRVERIEEPVDLVRVTPLRLLVADSPLGASGVRPALDATREVRSALFETVATAYCRTASFLLVGDIGVGIASGTGSLVLEVGGVEARSAEVVIEDPFGVLGAPAPVVGAAVPGAPAPAAGTGAVPAPAASTAAGPAPGGVAVATRPIATERVCESLHTFRWPPCSQGAAGVVGLVGAGATAAMAVLDLRRRRA